MNYKVGDFVKRRLHYANIKYKGTEGAISGGIKPNDIRKVINIAHNAQTGSRIRVWVDGGQEQGYCADWFELSKEGKVKDLLEKLNEV